MITIVDYGMGNLGSITNMLSKIGVESKQISNPAELVQAESIILPGVGAFDNAMEKLNKLGFSSVIIEAANKGIPILGICLGMQLLATNSEEGKLQGLNLIPGKVLKFNVGSLKVPHMGWNVVKPKHHKLYQNIKENRFYFVHSYFYQPENMEHAAGITDYGQQFVSSVARDNVFGAQFHPEKSHKFGMQFLTNFSSMRNAKQL